MAEAARGFTLTELLMVITIMGILAAVAVASLSTARERSVNAAIKSDLNAARSEAGLYSTANAGRYTGVCTNADGIAAILTSVEERHPKANSVTCNVATDGRTYAVSTPLVGSDIYYCIDSTGAVGEQSLALGSSTACQ